MSQQLRDALERIANPVKWEQEHLGLPNGARIVFMLKDPEYSRQIARDALAAPEDAELVHLREENKRLATTAEQHFKQAMLNGAKVTSLRGSHAQLVGAVEKYLAWCDCEETHILDFYARLKLCADAQASCRAALAAAKEAEHG